jgi:uncharacterized zinc-type alcohol dehydrogenase-like protein
LYFELNKKQKKKNVVRLCSIRCGNSIKAFTFERKELGEKSPNRDTLQWRMPLRYTYSKGDWGPAIYPLVPGHEIVGKVTAVGSAVSKFKVGEIAGVGCFVDSCRTCKSCKAGDEQLCDDEGMTGTYIMKEGQRFQLTVATPQVLPLMKKYTLHISDKLELSGVAPLLCAGITTYSPLRRLNVGKGHKVGVLGLGGLGHMAVKFAASFGAEVTMLSHSPSKEADAKN